MTECTGTYVGPDRRQPFSRPPVRVNRGRVLTAAAAVLVYGLVVPTAVAELIGTDQLVPAANIATVVSAVLFAQAGLLLLLRWRVNGDGLACRAGVGALVYGFFVAPLTEALGFAGFDTVHHAAGQALAQSLVGIVAAFFVVRAATSPPVDSHLRPVRSLIVAAALLGAACSAGYGVDQLVGRGAQLAFASAVAAVAAAVWFASGAVLARRRGSTAPRTTFLVAALVVMGMSSASWVAAMYLPDPFGLDASALSMVAGALVAGGAGYALLVTLSHQGASASRLRTLLHSLEQYQEREEERVHDARSGLQAVQAAVTVLTRHPERLDRELRTSLESAVDAEMARLLALMASLPPGEGVGRCEPFDVTEMVRTVVAAATLRASVRLDLPAGRCEAVGNRDDTARALENVLDNAQRYGAGSPVVVRLRVEGRAVALSVADRGPGVPPDERELVFTRGGRGQAAHGQAGSGLGLFAARRLMEDQGGSLVLETGTGPGARFVARLPALAEGSPSARADVARRPSVPGSVRGTPSAGLRTDHPGAA